MRVKVTRRKSTYDLPIDPFLYITALGRYYKISVQLKMNGILLLRQKSGMQYRLKRLYIPLPLAYCCHLQTAVVIITKTPSQSKTADQWWSRLYNPDSCSGGRRFKFQPADEVRRREECVCVCVCVCVYVCVCVCVSGEEEGVRVCVCVRARARVYVCSPASLRERLSARAPSLGLGFQNINGYIQLKTRIRY
jgi:hypothetical protein